LIEAAASEGVRGFCGADRCGAGSCGAGGRLTKGHVSAQQHRLLLLQLWAALFMVIVAGAVLLISRVEAHNCEQHPPDLQRGRRRSDGVNGQTDHGHVGGHHVLRYRKLMRRSGQVNAGAATAAAAMAAGHR